MPWKIEQKYSQKDSQCTSRKTNSRTREFPLASRRAMEMNKPATSEKHQHSNRDCKEIVDAVSNTVTLM